MTGPRWHRLTWNEISTPRLKINTIHVLRTFVTQYPKSIRIETIRLVVWRGWSFNPLPRSIPESRMRITDDEDRRRQTRLTRGAPARRGDRAAWGGEKGPGAL
jgi:hypothetical protein